MKTAPPAPEKPTPAPVAARPEVAATPPVPVTPPADPRKRPAAEVVAAILNGKLDPAKLPPPPKRQPEPIPHPTEPGVAIRIAGLTAHLPQSTLDLIAAAAANAPVPPAETHAPLAVVNLSDPPRAGQPIPELPGTEPPAAQPVVPAAHVVAGPSRPIVVAKAPPPTPAVIPPPDAPVIRPEPIPTEAFALNDKPGTPVLTDLLDFPPDARETARLTASTTPGRAVSLEASPENLDLAEPDLPAISRPRAPEPDLPADPDDSHFGPSELALLRNMAAKLPAPETLAPDKIPAANAIDTALKRLPDSIPADAIDSARKALSAVATAGPARDEIVAAVRQIREEAPDRIRDAAATLAQAKDAARDLLPRKALEVRNDLTPSSPEPLPESLPPGTVDARLGRIDIQSDRQADFDQANNKVIFTGKVQLNSPTLRLRASRVEVFMKKNGQGMARVEASGDVILQLQPTPDARPTMASAGRAVYDPDSGEMALYDWPKIQEPNKSHIATEAATKMKLFTDGRMTTEGANRTIIGGL